MVTVGSVWSRPISARNDSSIASLSRPHPPQTPCSPINSKLWQCRVSARQEQINLREKGCENLAASCGLTTSWWFFVVSQFAS